MKRGDAGVRNTRVREIENGFREIGFDSKPILEIDCKEVQKYAIVRKYTYKNMRFRLNIKNKIKS